MKKRFPYRENAVRIERYEIMAYKNRKTDHSNRQNRTTRYTYVEGSTVRRLNPAEQSGPRELSHSTRKNRDRALYMNLGYVVFLVAALVSAAVILIGYIRVQSDIVLSVQNISAMESELNSLKLSNDEEYNRAINSMDLEEIRQIAIGELGMRYAKEGQIINVTGEGSDYVRQLSEIGE
jgi:hypothetical protein